MKAINIIRNNQSYTIAQCPYCWIEFNMVRAIEYYDETHKVHPSVSSAVECPSCKKISYVFCWMDNDTNIPQ